MHICVKERRMKLLVAAFSVLIVLGFSTSVGAAGADVRRNTCNAEDGIAVAQFNLGAIR